MVKNLKTRILRFLLLIKPVRYLLYNYKNFKKLRVFNNLDLKTDSLSIDFGANEGIVSQYIFDKYKCNIVAYEPHPACEEILKKKFKNNKKIKKVFCELHGKPGTRKNDYLNTKYLKLINELKRLNLYNNWFIEHY